MDATIKIWNPLTGELIKTLEGHQDSIISFSLRRDGQQLATASDDGTCLVFSVA